MNTIPREHIFKNIPRSHFFVGYLENKSMHVENGYNHTKACPGKFWQLKYELSSGFITVCMIFIMLPTKSLRAPLVQRNPLGF
jgi:hypothetical protein